MNFKGKLIWGKIAFFFIVIHFALIFVYALPESLSTPRLKEYTSSYVEPIFTQRWSMFAPCPIIDGKIEVRYVFQDCDTIQWFRPSEDAQMMHNWTKGLHYGELVLAESNLIYWFSLDVDYYDLYDESTISGEKLAAFYDGYSYYKVKDYLFGNAVYHFGKKPIMGEVRFQLRNVVSNEENTITLPVYSF